MFDDDNLDDRIDDLYEQRDRAGTTAAEKGEIDKQIAALQKQIRILEGTEQDSGRSEKPKVVKDRGDFKRYEDQLQVWKNEFRVHGDIRKTLESAKSHWGKWSDYERRMMKNPDLPFEQYERGEITYHQERLYKKLAEIYEYLSQYSLNDYKQKKILKLTPISEIAKADMIKANLYDEVRFLQATKPGLDPESGILDLKKTEKTMKALIQANKALPLDRGVSFLLWESRLDDGKVVYKPGERLTDLDIKTPLVIGKAIMEDFQYSKNLPRNFEFDEELQNELQENPWGIYDLKFTDDFYKTALNELKLSSKQIEERILKTAMKYVRLEKHRGLLTIDANGEEHWSEYNATPMPLFKVVSEKRDIQWAGKPIKKRTYHIGFSSALMLAMVSNLLSYSFVLIPTEKLSGNKKNNLKANDLEVFFAISWAVDYKKGWTFIRFEEIRRLLGWKKAKNRETLYLQRFRVQTMFKRLKGQNMIMVKPGGEPYSWWVKTIKPLKTAEISHPNPDKIHPEPD